MVRVTSFTTRKVFFKRDGSDRYYLSKVIKTYEWNDEDCVYYNVDTDEESYMEIPANGKKTFSLKNGYDARLLVRDLVYGITEF